MSDAEAIVLGGGPAGCAAAHALARAGRRVILVERDEAPREVVCGEFLGPDAAAALARLGLDPAALGGAPIETLAAGHGWRESAAPLPFRAHGLSRRVLDGALREAARSAGTVPVVGRALSAAREGGLWRLRLAGGGTPSAPFLVLATGKHALRGLPRPGAPAGATGLKLHLDGVEAGRRVVLLPFPGGYAGLQPSASGANLCAALRGPPGAAGREAPALLALVASGSDLAARLLRGARPAWARPLAVSGVPYGWRHRPGEDPPGLYRVGDQAAVIHSLVGDGTAMALASGLSAAGAILAGMEAGAFHAAWAARCRAPMAWAGLAAAALRFAPGAAVRAAGWPALSGWVAGRSRIA